MYMITSTNLNSTVFWVIKLCTFIKFTKELEKCIAYIFRLKNKPCKTLMVSRWQAEPVSSKTSVGFYQTTQCYNP